MNVSSVMSLSTSSRSALCSSSLRSSSLLPATTISRLMGISSSRSDLQSFQLASSMSPMRTTSRSFSSSTRIFADKPQVLLLDEINFAKTELEQLQSVAEIVASASKSRDEFIKDLQGKYSNISAIYRHFGGARSIKVSQHSLTSKVHIRLIFLTSVSNDQSCSF